MFFDFLNLNLTFQHINVSTSQHIKKQIFLNLRRSENNEGGKN